MLLYLDTPPVVYSVENSVPFGPAVNARLALPGVVKVVSLLTRMECRVKPLRDGKLTILQDFEDFFSQSVMLPLSAAVLDKAAEIRAQYPSIKTPDAIHLAAAVLYGCDAFLTKDHRLSSFTGISIEVL